MSNVREYIGARYVPLIAGDWDSTKTYEALSVVLHQGNSYTSRQAVPAGIDISNETYWALTGNYNAQVEGYRSEVKGLDSSLTAEIAARIAGDEKLQEQIDELPFVTPEMFGAVGDGVTDDTEAVQKAIDTGNYIYVGKKYLCSNINIPAKKLLIAGNGTFVINGDSILFNISTSGTGLSFRDFTVEGVNYNGTCFDFYSNVNVIRWSTLFLNLRITKCAKVLNIRTDSETSHSNDGYSSENTFINCKLYNNAQVIVCESTQSVNNLFLNTSIEHERSISNPLPLMEISSGGFNFVGCSIIGENILWMKQKKTSDYSIINFTDCRFEVQYSNYACIFEGGYTSHRFTVNYTDCSGYFTNTNFVYFEANGNITFTNLISEQIPTVKLVKKIGVTIGSTGSSFSKYTQIGMLPVVEDFTEVPCDIDVKSQNKYSSFYNVTSKSINTNGNEVVVKNTASVTGQRSNTLYLRAPKAMCVTEFGIHPFNVSLPTGEIKLYALKDTTEFTDEPTDDNSKLLGTLDVASDGYSMKPTATLTDGRITFNSNYSQGKMKIVATNNNCGQYFVKFN